MMEHVRQFDWCSYTHEKYFVEEADLDNCNTEKILRNRFIDPMVTNCDSDDDEPPKSINWDEIFQKNKINKYKTFVPCLRPMPPYTKLSALDSRQHIQYLKVLSMENPKVLQDLFMGKPTKQDIKAVESLKETYLKEQKEYIDWAKSLWTTDHCIRALRPKPAVESVYEAEFKVKAQRMQAFPKNYDVAAQIPLESRRSNCEAVLKQELISVNLTEMPAILIPDKIERQFSIIRPCTMPEPCQKHPYQIVLPNETAVSMLPTTEIHRVLAAYALTNGTQYIASENALKCLMQWNRHWMLPLSVCATIGPDGETQNVMVLDSEFSVNKESAPVRTLKAFRHLLEYALIPSSERENIFQQSKNTVINKEPSPSDTVDVNATSLKDDFEMTSDEEDEGLVIDTGEDIDMDIPKTKKGKTEENKTRSPRISNSDSVGYITRAVSRRMSEECQDFGVYTCTCKDTIYEQPPRRSFKKWQFKNKMSHESYDIVIHCPHKAKSKSEEVILEPIPEYQIEVGASELTGDTLRSVALSLALRKNSSVVIARVDGSTGDVCTFETLSSEEFNKKHPEITAQVNSTVYAALSQLHGLLPGHYVLQHEPSHGANALLLSPRPASARHKLQLNFDSTQLAETDEAHMVKIPPTITNTLLPYHKYRRVLPCAFTPYDNQLVKDHKKPGSKKKPPPQAITWPKKKRSCKKR